MNIIIALNSVITVLRKTHVSGEEAKTYGQAIDILIKCVHALEEAKKGGEKHDENQDQQGAGD